MTHTVEISGSTFTFHSWGAAYWEEERMLLISDLHLGKIMHFRKYGAAVPRLALLENFRRLEKLEAQFKPEIICFLGDLFHSHKNREWELFQGWTYGSKAKLILVEGNHDILSPLLYEELGMQVLPEWNIGPFWLTHHPVENDQKFNIAGHIHPAVRLGGRGGQRMRLPCFYLRPNQLILPSFGAFTGSHTLTPEAGDRFVVLAGDELVALEQRGKKKTLSLNQPQ